MSNKPPSPPSKERAAEAAPRHRFTDEATMIMPLNEILRNRGESLPPPVKGKPPPVPAAPSQAATPPARPVPPAPPSAAARPPAAAQVAAPRRRREGGHQVVAFLSAKGGCGSTLLAANAAHHYARERGSTCLVDLDLQMGDGLASLSLQPRLTIAQAVTALQRGESLAPATLARHASGLSVLSQVGYIDDLDVIVPEGVSRLVENLRQSFDTVVVDGIRDFSDNALAVLDMADSIAIVTVQEVLALRRARWAFGILRKVGFDPSDITLLVNRFNPESDMSFLALKQIFSPARVMAVPGDVSAALQSQNRGIPLHQLSPTGALTRNVARMASQLVGEDSSEETASTSVGSDSLLSRLAFWRSR